MPILVGGIMELTDIPSRSASPRLIPETERNRNSQLCRILTSASRRASEAVVFFQQKEAGSDEVVKRAFYSYMGVKKDAQRVIIEKIARSQGIELAPSYSYRNTGEQLGATDLEIDEDFEGIFQTIHEVAADELEFYIHYAAVEKDIRINSILLMLVDLAKEFLFDVKIWYINHKEASPVAGAGLYASIP
jgi:hypothetical protein